MLAMASSRRGADPIEFSALLVHVDRRRGTGRILSRGESEGAADRHRAARRGGVRCGPFLHVAYARAVTGFEVYAGTYST